MSKKELLESYKGVRDFYPEDQFIMDYIQDTMARACQAFGFEHYGASVLESAELYKNKTSEEIVNEQTYIFEDRGGREVVLRPEMTPTVSRMVAKRRRELGFPLRLYSIPNVFRYERPQRGRLREHWQLNADIFGVEGKEAELEIISLAHFLMLSFGATEKDFKIKINSRSVLNQIFEKLSIPPLAAKSTLRLLDRKDKISSKEYKEHLLQILANETQDFEEALRSATEAGELTEYKKDLEKIGINNVEIDTSIVRGFDYYTGLVFEIYDSNPKNPRAMFGGGRYDNLMEALGHEHLPALGFGMGDVTIRDFLETHGLLPNYTAATELMILILDNKDKYIFKAFEIASKLRSQDINTAINFSYKKLDKQIKTAEKLSVPFILVLGEKEIESAKFSLKHLKSKKEALLELDEIPDYIFSFEDVV
jgi:histidyl-tRNA synthetase